MRLIDDFHGKLSYFDFTCLLIIFRQFMVCQVQQIKERHNKKLQNLWLETQLCTPENTVLNLSFSTFPDRVIDVLKPGLKHPVLPRFFSDLDIRVQLERACAVDKQLNPQHMNLQKISLLNLHLAQFEKSFQHKLSMKTHKIFLSYVKKLQSNDTIYVARCDKGNVIIDKEEYFSKLNAIVDDTSKFKVLDVPENTPITHHPILKQQNKISYFIKKYVKPHVSTDTLNFILPCGAQPGKLYGLVKKHKVGNPLRPVVSSIGTSEYNLAQYLNEFLLPVIYNKYSISSNTELLTSLKSYTFTPNSRLVSFDVQSLFTNIPLKESIEIAADYVYHSDNSHKPPFDRHIFTTLMHLATDGIFQFQDSFYKMTDGIAMGNPLAPVLSNLIMGHLEKKLNDDKKNVHFYARYVDDILAVFEDDDSETFLRIVGIRTLNSQPK